MTLKPTKDQLEQCAKVIAQHCNGWDPWKWKHGVWRVGYREMYIRIAKDCIRTWEKLRAKGKRHDDLRIQNTKD